jgi:hypothetical protein
MLISGRDVSFEVDSSFINAAAKDKEWDLTWPKQVDILIEVHGVVSISLHDDSI